MPMFDDPPPKPPLLHFDNLWSEEQIDRYHEEQKRVNDLLHPEWKMSKEDRKEYEEQDKIWRINWYMTHVPDDFSMENMIKKINSPEWRKTQEARSKMDKLIKKYKR